MTPSISRPAAPLLAVVGGGRLGRMMAPAAAALGTRAQVLVEGSPAGQVTVDVPVGAARDRDVLVGMAEGADAPTFENECAPRVMSRFATPQAHGL